MLYKREKETLRILHAKANPSRAAALSSLYMDNNSIDIRLSEVTNAEVGSNNANGISDLFFGSFNALNAHSTNNELTAAVTQLRNLLPWEMKWGWGGVCVGGGGGERFHCRAISTWL